MTHEKFKALFYGKQRVDFFQAIVNFYVLDELAHKIAPLKDAMLASRAKLYAEVTEHKQEFDAKLARAMFDYLALSTYGEARHGKAAIEKKKLSLRLQRELKKARLAFTNDNFPSKSFGGDRSYCLVEALKHDPKEFLPMLHAIFRGIRFPEYCGGKTWAKAAASAMLYFRFPAPVFIDHVVDLTHNGGLIWDKGVIFYHVNADVAERDLKRLLDYKQKHSLLLSTNNSLYEPVANVVERALTLGAIKAGKPVPLAVPVERRQDRLEPIVAEWGNEPMLPEKE